jgi:lysophospholipid acyltransferase (LPLAT)-like uncharacterized protein
VGVDVVNEVARGEVAPWWTGLAAWAGSLAVLGLGRSWRITRVAMDEYDARLERGERCIFAFWHARLLPLVYTHRGRKAAVLVSRHRDGELIARVMGRLGYATARGSSTRGGEEGVREMLSRADEAHILGITPDGPRGPAERAKPGIVYLASRTGWPVVPVAAGSRPSWVLRSWDRFRIPRPFARVVVAYGAPIHVPRDLDTAETERWRGEIEAGIAAVTADVDRRAGAIA